ncbi:hypothetical protein ABW20_dc0103593 [Dactylellina cionopaga]|nr:hypothetical protein ABW20_dc0103593 [Dactylellina cionopaga]
MNNSQFRNLVNNTPRVDRSSGSGNATSSTAAAPLLGSRQRSSIPMTPRSVGASSSFAQQAAAYRLQQNPPKEKKFKSSTPLGAKLPQGYVDRTKLRDVDDVTDSSAEMRMRALMELVEEGHLTREEAIEQSKAFGGDVESTHLVKGLDFRLLNRARKGEDVLSGEKKKPTIDDDEEMEDELDIMLEKQVESMKREKKAKNAGDDGDVAAPQQKTRAEILAEFRRSREEAAAKKVAENALGSKFKKIVEKEKKIKAPKEEKISTKVSGDIVSRKKRKREGEGEGEDAAKAMEKAIESGAVLGMLPPELPSAKAAPGIEQNADEGDLNIFDDAPDDYDPLAGLQDSDSSDSEEGEVDKPEIEKKDQKDMPPPALPAAASINRPRNYFATSSKDADVSTESIASKPLDRDDLANTAELSAAIKKAAQMRALSKANTDDEGAKKEARHKAMLQAASRDEEDVDMGFGGSRTFGDDDDDDLGVTKKKNNKKKKKI